MQPDPALTASPPLQMQSHELSAGSDVWALAMLLWEMMTESKPWEGIFHDFEGLRSATLRGARVPMPASTGRFPKEYVGFIRSGTRTLVHPPPPAIPPLPPPLFYPPACPAHHPPPLLFLPPPAHWRVCRRSNALRRPPPPQPSDRPTALDIQGTLEAAAAGMPQ
jgi:hypothetical protein